MYAGNRHPHCRLCNSFKVLSPRGENLTTRRAIMNGTPGGVYLNARQYLLNSSVGAITNWGSQLATTKVTKSADLSQSKYIENFPYRHRELTSTKFGNNAGPSSAPPPPGQQSPSSFTVQKVSARKVALYLESVHGKWRKSFCGHSSIWRIKSFLIFAVFQYPFDIALCSNIFYKLLHELSCLNLTFQI